MAKGVNLSPITDNKLGEYRKASKENLISRQDDFWKAWDELKPRDKVDSYIKLMSFFVPKVAVEVPLTPEQLQKMDSDELDRKAKLIAGGIEDIQYEDE